MSISEISFTPRNNEKKRRCVILAVLPFLLFLLFFLSLCIGSGECSISRACAAAFRGDYASPDLRILVYIRLARAAAAVLSGSALAVSGLLIQAVLLNPMAAPNLIGVNAGAGLSSILLIALFPTAIRFMPLFAFVGAMAAACLIYAVSAFGGADKLTVTLVGVAVGSILTAGINTVKTLFPDSVYDISGFMIGGLSGVSYRTLLPAALVILPSLVLAAFLARRADILTLGDEVAHTLGLSVTPTRFFLLALAAALAGSAVSFAGLLGFVGLLVPHIMRRLVGASHRALIPASAMGGAMLLLLSDLIARSLFSPYELPVGILLSLIGGPFFIFLLFVRRKERTR